MGRIIGEVDGEGAGREPQRHRGGQQRHEAMQRQRHDRRHGEQQHHVHRQDVEIAELVTKRCKPDIAPRRIGEQRRDIDIERLDRVGQVTRPREQDRRRRQHRHAGDARGDVAEIEQPGAPPALQGRLQAVALGKCRKIGLRRREAGQRHEDLRGIRKAEIDRGEMRQHIARDVIDEDRDERHAAQEVDPVLAAGIGQGDHGHTLYASVRPRTTAARLEVAR